jgi:predicted nucleotide-binding protein
MEKRTVYQNTRFGTEVFEEAVATFESELPERDRPLNPRVGAKSVSIQNETWSFDAIDEFFAEHRKPHTSAELQLYGRASTTESLQVYEAGNRTTVAVQSPERSSVVRVSAVFERRAAEFKLPAPPPQPVPKPRIFIGHGRSAQWRDLKDHLHDLHGHDIEAYETGARAGHTIRDILQEMVRASSFAVLVMTGEDETAEGDMRARQNVVHETGLFQGALGFARAIVLLEEGTSDYSNLQGIHQIRYSSGNIKETFGEVLAVLRREFGAV